MKDNIEFHNQQLKNSVSIARMPSLLLSGQRCHAIIVSGPNAAHQEPARSNLGRMLSHAGNPYRERTKVLMGALIVLDVCSTVFNATSHRKPMPAHARLFQSVVLHRTGKFFQQFFSQLSSTPAT